MEQFVIETLTGLCYRLARCADDKCNDSDDAFIDELYERFNGSHESYVDAVLDSIEVMCAQGKDVQKVTA